MSEVEESTASESSVIYDYEEETRSETPSESSYEEGERQPGVDQEAMRQVVDVLCDNAHSKTQIFALYEINDHFFVFLSCIEAL